MGYGLLYPTSWRNVMNAGTKMFRSLMLAGIVAGVVAAAGPARAADNPTSCTNDVDCIANPACGGDTCDWDHGQKCMPASASNKGWCGKDSDCKCMGKGATCNIPYCTITTPPTGTGGSSGSAGTAGTTGAAGTTGTAGSAGTAGTTGAAGASTGTAGKTTTSGGGGGCSIASSTSGGFAALVGLALVAGRLVRRRRRA
jgi:hypothetical protein